MVILDPSSPLPALVCVLIAVGVASALAKRFGFAGNHGQYSTIDGLRGYLAFFVFLHHSAVWFQYRHTGHWRAPLSHLYAHLGESAVSLFFMITAFLFFAKILDAKTRPVDWLHLFVSRLLRLTPLYLFVVGLMLLVVFKSSGWTFVETPGQVARAMTRWLSFTILGNPDLNGFHNTRLIVAGVMWSLPYEWFFYLALPVLAVLVSVRPAAPYIVLSIVGMCGCLYFWTPEPILAAPFGGGILAAYVVKIDRVCAFAKSRFGSLCAASCIVMTVCTFDSAYSIFAIALLSISFCLIASGATLFGLLELPGSKVLGQEAYSLYLLHGIVIFAVFTYGIGEPRSATLNPLEFWSIIAATVPFLVMFCYWTCHKIELPPMTLVHPLVAGIRTRLAIAKNPHKVKA